MGGPGPIAILGLGAVGTALARGLAAGGVQVRLWSRKPATRRRAIQSLRGRVRARAKVAATASEAIAGARLVLLCVPEPALAGLVAGLRFQGGSVVLLTLSGVAALEPLARRLPKGAVLGRFHPLCPVLARRAPTSFRGMPFGLEGPPPARRAGRALCRRLGGEVLELTGADPEGYHAGAALLGGGLVALHALATRAMAGAVRSPAQLSRALHAFAVRNADNVARLGPAAALTGPVARGAEENVRRNLRALARIPQGREAYRALGLTMFALAERRGGVASARHARLRRVLARGKSARR